MKRIVSLAIMIMICIMANAQMTKKDTGNGSFNERVTNLWNKTKKSLDKAAENIENEFSSHNSGLRRIEGKYYMNIYDTNLYKGEDAEEMTSLCRKEFEARYPNVKIRSCVIPQTDWQTETVETAGEVTGYAKTLYCYILAKDGDEGYINAKFVFEKQKKVGEAYTNTKVKWPLWMRTDVLTNHVMERLITEK